MEFIRDIDALSRQHYEAQRRELGLEPEPEAISEAHIAAGGVQQTIRRMWKRVTGQDGTGLK